jgi:hypothetical protein
MLPALVPNGLPSRCQDHAFRRGRCAEHYADWIAVKETRRLEAAERAQERKPIPSTPGTLRLVPRGRGSAQRTTELGHVLRDLAEGKRLRRRQRNLDLCAIGGFGRGARA